MFARLKFETDGDTAECLAERLDELGALAVTLQAADDSERFDEPDAPAELWPSTAVCAWFEADGELAPVIDAVAGMRGRPAGIEYVADRDWLRAARDTVGPLRIADRLWVVPSWCQAPDPAAVNVRIDPGLAFGTGDHPTTRMSLRWLAARELAGREVLDYGCGSGILAIAAALLGARRAVGVDCDVAALSVASRNAAVNGVAQRVEFRPAGQEPEADYPLLVANILLRPLLELSGRFAALQSPGGRLALSGITADQEPVLARALAVAGYRPDAAEQLDGWSLLTAIRQ